MKLYTIPEVAEYADCSESKVRRAIKLVNLVGQIAAGTYIFTQKAVDAWLTDGHYPSSPTFFTINTASELYGYSRNRLTDLIKVGLLPAIKIKARGPSGWAYVFTYTDLMSVGKGLAKLPSGPAVKDGIDQYIEFVQGGRYAIIGTKNKFGKPFTYKNKNQARRRAREAYANGLRFKAAEIIKVRLRAHGQATEKELVNRYGEGWRRVAYASLLEGVTGIDVTMHIRLDDGANFLVPIKSWLWGQDV